MAQPAAGMPGMPGMPPFGLPFPWQWPPYQTPAQAPKARYEEMPSSDPVDEVEDVTLFPRIKNWLQSLDDGMRGHDGHTFAQFAADFEREKYIRIVDLVDMRIGDLKHLVPEMAQGTATKLLAYAAKDVGSIRRKEKKRQRRENNRFT